MTPWYQVTTRDNPTDNHDRQQIADLSEFRQDSRVVSVDQRTTDRATSLKPDETVVAYPWAAVARARAPWPSPFRDGLVVLLLARHHLGMLQISVRSVHPDQVEDLRQWFTGLQTTRRDETIATLIDETVTQETAILIPNGGNPILVYAMEVADPIQSKTSAKSGKHPIDAEHRTAMRAAISGVPEHEIILDISAGARSGNQDEADKTGGSGQQPAR